MGTKEYRDCYVAFLDLLGFKNMIGCKDCNELYDIFESIKESSVTSVIVNDDAMETFDRIEYTIMSDSVVVYVDANLDDAFFALLCTCQTIQMNLMKKGILLRGGIARGTLFREQYVIFGQGLSKAYLLENNIASYPRIIFNRELLNDGDAHNITIPQGVWDKLLIAQDDDELFYINPVSTLRAIDVQDGQDNVPAYFDMVLSMCQEVLDTNYECSIREKYLWLKSKTIKELQGHRKYILDDCNGEAMLTKWNI